MPRSLMLLGYTSYKIVHKPKKFDLEHKRILPHRRVGSGHKRVGSGTRGSGG